MLTVFILGCLIGFTTAIPVAGPVSAIVFSKGMKGKYSDARSVAFGAAFAESIYTLIAFWGVSQFLIKYDMLLKLTNLVAAIVLLFLGIHFYRSKKMRTISTPKLIYKRKVKRFFILGLGISFLNPTLIATWTAAITTIYSLHLFQFSIANSILFSTGVCLGITLWFIILLELIKKYRDLFDQNILDKILKSIGICLIFLSIWIINQKTIF